MGATFQTVLVNGGGDDQTQPGVEVSSLGFELSDQI